LHVISLYTHTQVIPDPEPLFFGQAGADPHWVLLNLPAASAGVGSAAEEVRRVTA